MKPPVVHQPAPPPQPADTDAAAHVQRDATTPPEAGSSGLVGSLGPLVGGRTAPDHDGVGADERKAP